MSHRAVIYTGNAVPEEIYGALEEHIEEYNLEYADNYRFTPTDDDEGMGEFEEISSHGCCGSAEFTAKDATGREWMIGCNYGH